MITKCYADLWEWKLFCSTTLNKEGMQTIERVMDLSYGSVMMFCHFHSLLGHVEARGNVHCRHNSAKHNNIVKEILQTHKLLYYIIFKIYMYFNLYYDLSYFNVNKLQALCMICII